MSGKKWYKFFLFISPRKKIHNLNVYASILSTKSERKIAFKKIDEALMLISKYMPLYFSNIQKHTKYIFVMGDPTYRGLYFDELKLIEIHAEFVVSNNTSIEIIASTIVHEAQHARLNRLGFGYDEKIRNRIENICFKAERNFASKIPNGTEILKEINMFLNRDDTDIFSNEARRNIQIAALRDINFPEWILKVLLWISDKRSI